MYAIVEFIDEGSIAVVSSEWITQEGICLWPPVSEKYIIRSLAKTGESPKDNWFKYEIDEWLRTDDWEEVNRKAQRLDRSSNVTSNEDENSRKCKRFKCHSNGNVGGENCEDDGSRKDSLIENLLIPITRITSAPASPFTDNQPESPVCSLNSNDRELGTASTSSDNNGENRSLYDSTLTSSSKFPDIDLGQTCCERFSRKILKTVLESRNESKNEIRHLREELGALKAEIRKIKIKLAKKSNGSASTPSPVQMFPLQTIEQFQVLEQSLQDEEVFDIMVDHFSSFRGKMFNDGLKSMLEEAFSNALSTQFNLSGRGKSNKRAFQHTKLYRVIFEALRSLFPMSTEKDLRTYVVNWFDGARDRAGGRKNRRSL